MRELPARHRPQRGALPDLRELLPRPGSVRHAEEGRDRLLRRNWSWIWPRWRPSVAGPKRPQDRIELPDLKRRFNELLTKPVAENGFGKQPAELARSAAVRGYRNTSYHFEWTCGTRKPEVEPSESEMRDQHPAPDHITVSSTEIKAELRHGSVLIASITSCTNTSQPERDAGGGSAGEEGGGARPAGQSGGQDLAGARLAGGDRLPEPDRSAARTSTSWASTWSATAAPRASATPARSPAHLEEAMVQNDLVAASVLSGNRNFEARDPPEHQGQLSDVAAAGGGVRPGRAGGY